MGQSFNRFPVLDIDEFRKDHSLGCDLLFHTLSGESTIDSPHRHDFFFIILFEKGSGTHTIDFQQYDVKDRQIHLLFPDQVHYWNFENRTKAYQLMISRKWFEIFFPSLRQFSFYYQNNPVFVTSQETFQPLLTEFLSIQKELEKADVFWEILQVRCKLIELMLSKIVIPDSQDFEIYHSNPVLGNFLKLIDMYFKTERQVSFFADKLNITANHLNVICRKNLNTPASSLIKDRLLLEAKRMLMVSGISLKEIVYELGFYDHANFTKFFKTQTGMTPSEFKEHR